MVARCRLLLAAHGLRSCLSVRTQPLAATGAPLQTSTIPWVCYRRRNQWLRLALALFCLPLIWLARVVYLLVGVAEGWDGRRGHPCAVLGYAMLRYNVGVGVGVMRVSGRCFVALLARHVFTKIKGICEFYFIWDRRLWRGWCLCGFMAVGLRLLHVVGGINVASRWGCVQGVWEQCRCWSLGMGSRVSNVSRWDYISCS